MPKNLLISGPSIAGVTTPPSFGAALAAARADVSVPAPEFVGTCPVCEQGVTAIQGIHSPIEAEPESGWAKFTPGQSAAKYEPCGHTTGPWDEVAALFASDGSGRGNSPTTRCPACDEPAVDELTGEVDADGNRALVFKPCGHELAGEGAEAFIADSQNYPYHGKPLPTGPEGGEQPSPGNSSLTSPKKRQPKSSEPKPPSQSRARGTANRSRKPAADSTAGSAADAATNSADNN